MLKNSGLMVDKINEVRLGRLCPVFEKKVHKRTEAASTTTWASSDQAFALTGEPTMPVLETMIVGALTVIVAAPIYALVAKAKKNRVLGHKFSKTTNYIVLFVVIVLWLVVCLLRK